MVAATKLYELAKALKQHDDLTTTRMQSEIAKGYSPLKIDERHWYSSNLWHEGVISIDGNKVRIVAIMAKYPGCGSFKRMLNGIWEAGLLPVVVQPLPYMEKILRRWKWTPRTNGEGLQAETQWAEKWLPIHK